MLKPLLIFLSLPFLLLSAIPALAVEGSDDTEETLEAVIRKAGQGDPEAQTTLGVLYADGDGLAQDDKEAVKWFSMAAKQGDLDSERNMGLMYLNGRGVPEDHRQAAGWFLKAAERGDSIAQYYMGYLYRDGLGVDMDEEESLKWYRLAAEQGDPDAENYLEERRQRLESENWTWKDVCGILGIAELTDYVLRADVAALLASSPRIAIVILEQTGLGDAGDED